MTDKDMELSKEGIKLSYRRFLSDTAPGIIILIMVILYYPSVIQVPENIEIFVYVLLIFLSIPLGVAINSFSFLFFGGLLNKCEVFWLDKNLFLIRNTKTKFEFDTCEDFFNSENEKWTKENWTFVTRRFEKILEVYYPNHIERLEFIEGMKTLFLNISLLSLVFIIIIFPYDKMLAIMSLFLSAIFIITSSIISFYRFLDILNITYILCLRCEQFEKMKHELVEITNCLVRNS